MSTGIIVTCDRYTTEDTTHDGIRRCINDWEELKRFKHCQSIKGLC